MSTMIQETDQQDYSLTVQDRCDSCQAQAYVRVIGVSGDLVFCAHHYNKIMDNAVGYDRMMKFAYNIIDERDKLDESRTKGDSY